MEFETLKELEIKISTFQYKTLNAELKAMKLENGDFKKREEELSDIHRTFSEKAALSKNAIDKTTEELQKTKLEISETASSIDKNMHRVLIGRERIEELKNQTASLTKEINLLKEKLESKSHDLENFNSSFLSINGKKEDKVNEIMEKNKGLMSREGAIKTLMHQKSNIKLT